MNANVDLANKPELSRPLNSIKTASFTNIEIDQAIKEFSGKKSPWPDYALTADVLKDGVQAIREILFLICNIVFKECHAPTQWASRIIILSPKKRKSTKKNEW